MAAPNFLEAEFWLASTSARLRVARFFSSDPATDYSGCPGAGLFLTYCSQRIDFGRASCRNIAGNQRHDTQETRDRQIYHRIVRVHTEKHARKQSCTDN